MTTTSVFPAVLEQGDPAQDPRAFRKCLGQFATGVTVMTTALGEQLAGMSVNSFAALSLEPPLVLWSIRRESSSLDLFREAGHYAVNILAEDQIDISNRFAKPGEEKFAQTRWREGRFGAPLLDGVVGTLECRLEQVLDGGDHYILMGRVEHYAVHGGNPLLFVQGRYAVPDEPPPATPCDTTSSSCDVQRPSQLADASLLRQLHYASHLMSSCFDRKRQELGLGVAEFRLYGWLRWNDMSEAELTECLYLGENELSDAIHSLRKRGHLITTSHDTLALTDAGRAVSLANVEHVRRFEAQLLEGVAQSDLAAMQRVIDSLVSRARERCV